MVLFDTNLLVYAHIVSSPYHAIARQLRDEAAAGRIEACLSPQILCEFFAVCTDGRIVQPALTPAQANREMFAYWTASGFRKILPKETTIRRMLRLTERYKVKQQDVFDAFLAATMLDNEVRIIYTHNTKDFEIYKELQVIDPFVSQVAA